MKKNFVILLFITIFLSCTRTIHFYDYTQNAEGVSLYGNSSQRNFYINENIEIDKEPLWDTSIYASFSKSSFVTYDTVLFVADLGGRITAMDIKNGKKKGEIKYKGSIEQAPIRDNENLIFIVNSANEKYSEFIVYDFVSGRETENTMLDGKVSNEFIMEGKNIFVLSDFGKLYKFNMNGVLLWQKDLKDNFFSDPSADSVNLYAVSLYGNLYSIKLDDGTVNYKKNISSGFQSGVSLKGNNIFVGDENGNMFSINKPNGEINWKYNTKFKIRTIPSYDNYSLYFGNLNGDLYSLELNNGSKNWILKTDGLINTTPLIFKNILIQPNLNKFVDLVNKENGEVIEKIPFDGRCRTTPFYYADKLLLGIDKDDVYCFSVKKKD